MSEERGEHRPWPQGLLLLAAIGALCGWLFDMFARGGGAGWALTDEPVSLGLGAAAAAFGLAFAWTLERERWQWTLLLAVGAALTFLAIVHWDGSPVGRGADVQWRYVALLVGFAAAVPLFQAMRDDGRFRYPYVAVHWYAWTDVAAALLVGALIAAALLLGVDESPMWTSRWSWAALGAILALAIGLARTIAAQLDLQLALRRLLALSAPIVLLLVLALPLLAARTGSLAAASLLLGLAAILVLNAVLGNGPDQQSPLRILRACAMALAPSVLLLGLVAGAALWIRIGDHGYSPNRLWAAVFALAILAIGIRYAVSLARRRAYWAEPVRRNNVRILAALFFLGLILATPLASFSHIATNDQMARLEEGRIGPAEFDWRALRFDFGRAGVRALQALREGVDTPPELRVLSARALEARDRSEAPAPEPRRP